MAGHDRSALFELGPYHAGDEKQIFSLLAECHPDSWGRSDPDLWHWKHLERPGFEADDIIVARHEGRIVGCFHGAIRPLRLAPGVTVSASYDGDYAVLPEARGHDLTGRAYALSDPDLVARGVAVRGGFTSKELNARHYGKKYGYVFVRAATGQFRKIIGLGPLRTKVQAVGEHALRQPRLRRALRRYPLTVGVAVQSLPEAILSCTAEGFALEEGAATSIPVSIHLPYPLLAALPDGVRAFARQLLRAVLARRAKIRGIPTALVRFLLLTVAALFPIRAAKKQAPAG